MRPRFNLLLVGLAVLLAGCSAWVEQAQPNTESGQEVSLTAGHTLGQTFVARYAGLNGMEIFLAPRQSGNGQLRLHLRSDSQASLDLTTATIPLAQITGPAFYTFSFTPLSDSDQHYYYAFIELEGAGGLTAGAAPGAAYLDGAIYQDHKPLDAQMAFRLTYSPWQMWVGFVSTALRWLGILGVGAFLYVAPGWGLLVLLWPENRLAWAEKLGVGAGLSLALYPLLFVWTDFIGLHLGVGYAWLPALSGLALILWRGRIWQPKYWMNQWQAWRRSSALTPDLILIVISGLIFTVRFWVIRSVAIPLWADSTEHTLMTQLLIDHGGLFNSWRPYVPYVSLSIQFGFSVIVAVFSWLTGMGSSSATLFAGQLINGLAVVSLYPLAIRLADGNRWAGVGTVLVAGLLSLMPADYVNWGRYAQLASQAILPAALWLLCEALEGHEATWSKVGFSGGILAGMALTYYRMPFFYAAFACAWLMGWGLLQRQWQLDFWLRTGLRLILIAVIALALFSPWLRHLQESHLANVVEAGVTASASVNAVLAAYQEWPKFFLYIPWPLLLLSFIGGIASLIQKRWRVVAISLWIAILCALVATQLLRLPGANFLQNFAVVIALYMPIGLLIGWLSGQIAAWLEQRLMDKQFVFSALVVGVSLWAAWNQGRVVLAQQPVAVLVTRPDQRALAWIREHTSPAASFLVEGFRIYNGQSIVGSDAGWWIPLLAGRENTLPPQYPVLNEVPSPPDYTQRAVALVAQLEKTSLNSPEGIRLLCAWDLSHVYIGQRQGQVHFVATQLLIGQPPSQLGLEADSLFSPDELSDNAAFDLVYHVDRVYIFQLKSSACHPGA